MARLCIVREAPPCFPGRPPLWHVVWNEGFSFDNFTNRYGYFITYNNPRLYRAMQTTVPDFNFATGSDVS
jgi:hypothetical protein